MIQLVTWLYLYMKSRDNLPPNFGSFYQPESVGRMFCCRGWCMQCKPVHLKVTRWMWQLQYLWIHCRTEQQLMGHAFIQIVAKTCWLCPSRRIDRLHTNTLNILLSSFLIFSPIPHHTSPPPFPSHPFSLCLTLFVGQFANISFARFGITDCVLRLCIIYQFMCVSTSSSVPNAKCK